MDDHKHSTEDLFNAMLQKAKAAGLSVESISRLEQERDEFLEEQANKRIDQA